MGGCPSVACHSRTKCDKTRPLDPVCTDNNENCNSDGECIRNYLKVDFPIFCIVWGVILIFFAISVLLSGTARVFIPSFIRFFGALLFIYCIICAFVWVIFSIFSLYYN